MGGEKVGRRCCRSYGTLHTVGVNAKWPSGCGKQHGGAPEIIKIKPSYGSEIPLQGF